MKTIIDEAIKGKNFDIWGLDSDEWMNHDTVEELIDDTIASELEEIDTEDIECAHLSFVVVGGKKPVHHISDLFGNAIHMSEFLNELDDDGSFEHLKTMDLAGFIEEQYAECVLEINTLLCDPYSMPDKMAKSLKRIFYREAKRYSEALKTEDEKLIDRAANVLLRRFKRAVRHLPTQDYGMIFNTKRFQVVVKAGVVTEFYEL